MCCGKQKIEQLTRPWWETVQLQGGGVAKFISEEEARRFLDRGIDGVRNAQELQIYTQLYAQKEQAEGE